MKIDLHTHSKPCSRCAHHEPEIIPEMFARGGYGAIVLTNHCYPAHLEGLSSDLKEQARIYVETYHREKTAGDSVGLKVLFGVEVKLINVENHPEFLLYGISEKDFLELFPLYDLTQKQLYDICCERDILMVQAHPYRTAQGYAPCDLRYVHGIEIYNPHPHFDPRLEDAVALAEGKIKTSGSDFHIESQVGNAAMIVPDDITDQFMLRDYLKKSDPCILGADGIVYQNGKIVQNSCN